MAENANSPAPAPQGATPPAAGGAPGSATPPDISKVVSEAVARAVGETKAELEARLQKMAEDHKAEIRRLKAKDDGDPKPQPNSEEIAGLNRQVEELKAERLRDRAEAKKARLEIALTRHLSNAKGLREGAADDLTEMLSHKLEEDSQGRPVIKRDGVFVPLATVIAEFETKPAWQAPANRGGGGRSGERLPTGGGGAKKQIFADDHAAFEANLDGIAKGEVEVVPRQ